MGRMEKSLLWKSLKEAGGLRVGTFIDARVRYNSKIEESAVKFQTEYHHRFAGTCLVIQVKKKSPMGPQNIIVFSLKEQ